MSEHVRLLLVDDQSLVRAGVRRVLEAEPDFEVVGEAENGDQALAIAREHPAELMVLDLNMPGRDGFEVLRELRRTGAALRVLVLSLHDDAQYVARAVREGADGYVLKDSAVQELPGAIRSVLAGRGFYSSRVQVALTEAVRGGDPFEGLSPREMEVLRRVAAGASSKAIAAELFISVRTVESHRASLMRKLELRSVAELTRFALEKGLLRSP
jgi:DNA-binding NarL/FixJ family response regulator